MSFEGQSTRAGLLRPGESGGTAMSKLTQHEFAKQLGLSYKTVSRALNGYDCVREDTRLRVLREAERLGFHGHATARALRLQKSFAIGVVHRNTGQTFWLDVMEAMDQRCREAGYHLVLCHRRRDCNSSEEVRFLLERQIDALVVTPHPSKEDLELLRTVNVEGAPVLLLGQWLDGLDLPYLGTDGRNGSRRACEHLLALGHRRIAYVTGPAGDNTAEARLAGYHDAMAAAGIPEEERVVVTGGWRRQGGETAGCALLARGTLPTAIMAVSDATASGVYLALRRAGLRVPEDISLVGYGNESAGELMPSPLTTVRQPAGQLGCRAVEIALRLIDGEDGVPSREELPDELLVRQSSAPPGSGPLPARAREDFPGEVS